jgi:hypothetical protein
MTIETFPAPAEVELILVIDHNHKWQLCRLVLVLLLVLDSPTLNYEEEDDAVARTISLKFRLNMKRP